MMAASLLLAAALTAAPDPAPAHRLSLHARANVTAYLSDARSKGGLGGGVGLRDTVHGRWLLQADVGALTGLGSVLEARLGAGVQRQGFWAPAALLSLTGLFGDQLSFALTERDHTVRGPALGVGVTLAPARFQLGEAQVSLLEVGVGVGSDLPGRGLLLGLTLLEVGVAL
ncbi:hypothetical protein [Melittangium boletus]|uniref:hypothetical protein n=1 Tax=Melittangium boletus TaxID=83453 RepID=UPI003DA5333F